MHSQGTALKQETNPTWRISLGKIKKLSLLNIKKTVSRTTLFMYAEC